MNKDTQYIRSNSKLVYGFCCTLNEQIRRIKISAIKNKSYSFSVDLLDRAEVEKLLLNEIKKK